MALLETRKLNKRFGGLQSPLTSTLHLSLASFTA